MKTLSVRTCEGERDLEAIASLINTCEEVDRLEEGTSVPELRESWNDPHFDPRRDLRLWEDSDGRLLAYAKVYVPESEDRVEGYFGFRVRPEVRGGDLEGEIVAWGEAHLREVGKGRTAIAKLRSGTRADRPERVSLLESWGFKRDRYFFQMARSLSQPIPEPQFLEGFYLRPTRREDIPAWVEMFNQTFIDHWNHRDLTAAELYCELEKSYYRPELDLVAIAPDGTFAAFCFCGIFPQENERTGRNEGWIAALGTRRGFRRQGLGRAMLLSGLRCLRDAGVDTAKLGVDADNPSGALKLYESVGFHRVRTSISYSKEIVL